MEVAPLTHERLKALLAYDPESGVFTWRVRAGRHVMPGDQAGCISSNGYVVIRISGRQYRAHRLAWLYMRNEWPAFDLDHRDTCRQNNAWSNLRPTTDALNSQNRRRANRNSSTGLLGVVATKEGDFHATIRAPNRARHIGTFDTAEEAHAAYLAEKRLRHAFNTL